MNTKNCVCCNLIPVDREQTDACREIYDEMKSLSSVWDEADTGKSTEF
jgi:hypothetical protein